MITYEPRSWFTLLFRWHGSVVPGIFLELIVAIGIGFLAYWMVANGYGIRGGVDFLDSQSDREDASGEIMSDHVHTMLGVPLGFLLIFRSNSAYGRYWCGRGRAAVCPARSLACPTTYHADVSQRCPHPRRCLPPLPASPDAHACTVYGWPDAGRVELPLAWLCGAAVS